MNSYDISLMIKLIAQKKLLVGSGSLELDPLVDLPFVRAFIEDKACPYIPGSSFKGVLRSTLIRLAEALGETAVKSVHPSVIGRSEDIACRLFGRPHEGRSKVSVKPAYLEAEPATLTHVKIKDSERVAERGGLYTAEYLPKGTTAFLSLEANGLSAAEAEALFAAIAGLNSERFGRGGLVRVEIDRSRSTIPEELVRASPIIRLVLEKLGGGGR